MSKKHYISFDVGGTNVKWAILTEDFKIVKLERFSSIDFDNDAKEIFTNICKIINDFKQEFNLILVGISAMGVINADKSIAVYHYESIKGFQGFKTKEFILKKTNLPSFIDNDVNCATAAELLPKGSLHNINNGIMITIGTGIGGGVVIDGDVVRGSNWWAGEMGVMSLGNDPHSQSFSRLGSTYALCQRVEKRINKEVDGEWIFKNLNNKKVKTAYDEWLKFLAQGIANTVVVTNPEVFVIGGGISSNKEFKMSDVIKALDGKIPKELINVTKFKKASFRNDAGLLGAANLAKINILKK